MGFGNKPRDPLGNPQRIDGLYGVVPAVPQLAEGVLLTSPKWTCAFCPLELEDASKVKDTCWAYADEQPVGMDVANPQTAGCPERR